jgi:hypothetical protein
MASEPNQPNRDQRKNPRQPGRERERGPTSPKIVAAIKPRIAATLPAIAKLTSWAARSNAKPASMKTMKTWTRRDVATGEASHSPYELTRLTAGRSAAAATHPLHTTGPPGGINERGASHTAAGM